MNRWIQFKALRSSRRLRSSVVLSSILAIVLIAFQNCSSDVEFSKKSAARTSPISESGGPGGAMTINKGTPYTNNMSVYLDIEAYRAVEMAIANDACPDATAPFQPIVSLKDWILSDKDGMAQVGMLLRDAEGKISECISASITLDRMAPTMDLSGAYAKMVAVDSAEFKMLAVDELSGVDKVYCAVDTSSAFKECSLQEAFAGLKEGSRLFTAYVTDKAGNSSDVLNHSWLVDLTAPTVAIIDPKPAAISIVNTVNVYFEGKDVDGSGVQKYSCYLDDKALGDCTSPQILSNLTEGNHKFSVVAYDNVNWMSKVAEHAFAIDTKPSGDFQIMGVRSSKKDDKVDNYLSDDGYPMVYWTASLGAQTYTARILNQDKSQTVCGPVTVKGDLLYATFNSDCALVDGQNYFAAVTALKNTFETKAPDFMLSVDLSAPVIVIKDIVKDDEKKTATISFAVSDATSGLQTVVCYKTYGNDAKTDDCLDKTYIDYTNLTEGDHQFYITAIDKLGHTATSTPVSFKIQYVVCDPFKLSEGKCQRGLKARLFYASAADRAAGNLGAKFNTVGKLIAGGVQSNAIFYLPFLDVRTREFTSGFSTTANTSLKDDSGKLLDEWFALDMETVLKLGTNDQPGYYQLIILSDDGSNVYVDRNGTNQFTKIINNDGLHSTRVGCTAAGDVLDLSATSRIAAKIEYYQGPRTQIGASLLWRKVDAVNAPLSQYCGRSDGPGGWGFGTPESYQLLFNEGFKPLSDQNFILKEALPVAP